MGLRTALGLKRPKTNATSESAKFIIESAKAEAPETTLRFPSTSSAIQSLRAHGIEFSTVLDVGVQHCSPELIAACPDLPHVLFEPASEFYPSIAHNYRHVRHELVAAAVSDKSGEAQLKVESIVPGFSISHSALVEDCSEALGVRTVPVVSVDDFLSSRPDVEAPFLLKIDIDGLELKVISGARKTLEKCIAVIIELHIPGDFFERSIALQDTGFQLVDIVDLAYYDGALQQVDGIFLRADLLHSLRKPGRFDFAHWQNFKAS